MNQDWSSSLQTFWQSPNLPMWLTIAALGFFALILLLTLFRAERSLANGALTVITMLSIGIAVAGMLHSSGAMVPNATFDSRASVQSIAALSCLDGIAGETVEATCEKALFASADATAAAVSYSAAQITRLASFGNVAAANNAMSPELNSLRRAVERDRFGLVAHVLMTREGCTLSACPFFQSLTNSAQISSNMNERFYDGIVGNYVAQWNVPASAAAGSAGASLAPVAPTGRPMSGDFPSAASIPPVTIMSPESAPQGSSSPPPRPVENVASSAPRVAPAPAATAAKKQATPKTRAQAPTSLVPQQPVDDN